MRLFFTWEEILVVTSGQILVHASEEIRAEFVCLLIEMLVNYGKRVFDVALCIYFVRSVME